MAVAAGDGAGGEQGAEEVGEPPALTAVLLDDGEDAHGLGTGYVRVAHFFWEEELRDY